MVNGVPREVPRPKPEGPQHSGFGSKLGPNRQHFKILLIHFPVFLCSLDGIDMSEKQFQGIFNF